MNVSFVLRECTSSYAHVGVVKGWVGERVGGAQVATVGVDLLGVEAASASFMAVESEMKADGSTPNAWFRVAARRKE